MMAQVTAAALVSECKTLSHPGSVDTIPTSANQEDHVSMAPWCARKLTQVLANAERVVAVEAFFELHLRHPRAINLCSDSSPDLTYGDLINTAAKMRPDRLVFSELRGPETLRILDLLRGGYDGSLAAIHATSAEDVLARLETQCLTANLGLGLGEIRAIIASAVNVISVQQRQPATGARKIVEIVEVDGLEHDRYRLQPLVRYEPATEEFKVLGKPSWE